MKEKTISQISNTDGLAERLALMIRHIGLTQSEFALRLGASPGFVSDVARGVKKPGAEFLHGLAYDFFRFLRRPYCAQHNVATYIIGPELGDGQMEYRPANTLKVWPQRGSIECLRPDEFNPRIIDLVTLHCR